MYDKVLNREIILTELLSEGNVLRDLEELAKERITRMERQSVTRSKVREIERAEEKKCKSEYFLAWKLEE